MSIFRIFLLTVTISSCRSALREHSTPVLIVTPARIEAWSEQQVDVSCHAKNMSEDFYLKWFQHVHGKADPLLSFARNQDTLPLRLLMKKSLNGTRVVCKAFNQFNDVQLASTGYLPVHVKDGLTPGMPTRVMPPYPRMSITPDRGTVEGRVGDAIELLCHCENLYPFSTIHWVQIKGYFEAPLNGTKDNYLQLRMNLTKLDNGTTVYCRTGFKEPITSREIKIRVLPAPEPIQSAVSMLQLPGQHQLPRYPIFTLTPNATSVVVKVGEITEHQCRVDNVVNTSIFRLSWNQRILKGNSQSNHIIVEEYKSLNLTLNQTWQASDNRSFIYCTFFQEHSTYTSPFIAIHVVNDALHASNRLHTTITTSATSTVIIVSSALVLCVLLTIVGLVIWCCCRRKPSQRSRMATPSCSDHGATSQEQTYSYVPVEIVDIYKARELAAKTNIIRNNAQFVPALPARNRREENIYTPMK